MQPRVLKPLPRRLVAVGYFLLAACVVAVLVVQNLTLQDALAHARSEVLVNRTVGVANQQAITEVLGIVRLARGDHTSIDGRLDTLAHTITRVCH